MKSGYGRLEGSSEYNFFLVVPDARNTNARNFLGRLVPWAPHVSAENPLEEGAWRKLGKRLQEGVPVITSLLDYGQVGLRKRGTKGPGRAFAVLNCYW